MEHKIEKIPKSKIIITVSLSTDEMKKYSERVISDFVRNVEVKGFRIGKAPRNLVVERVGQNRINSEAANIAVQDSCDKIISENDIDVLSQPKIEIIKFVPEQELEYKAELAVLPEFELPNYKEIAEKSGKEDRQEFKVEEKELKDALGWILNSRVKYAKVDRASQKGDLIVISYELRSGGVKIEGGDQKQHPIILGEGKLMPGFEDAILGLKTGEEKEFSLDAPKNFPNSQITGLSAQAGKKIDFKVKIDDLMQRDLPELDDEFARSIGQFENLASLEKSIKDGLLAEKEQAEKERFRIALISKIAAEIKMDVPDEIIDSETNKMIHELEHDVKHRGMEFDKYLEHIKKTKDDLKKEFREKAAERAKISFAIREIGKAENIKVSDEELEEKMKEIATKMGDESRNIDPERIHNYTENVLVNEKVFELLEKLAE